MTTERPAPEQDGPATDDGHLLPPPRAVHRAGETAVLADYPDTAAVLAAAAAVRALAPAPLADLVPAERSLLLRGVTVADARDLAGLLAHLPPAPAGTDTAAEVEIDVVYDGEDLEETAALLGLDVPALVTAHSGAVWTAAFGGFAPGFAYLIAADDGDEGGPPWQVPRRSSPRTAVPPGSVALAAGYCGVYPRSSPGGWQLVGRTDAVLFDETRIPPALLTPGTRVRFRPRRDTVRAGAAAPLPRGLAGTRVGAAATSGAAQALAAARREAAAAQERLAALRPGPAPGSRAARERALEVLAPGPLLLVEDAGRPGRAAIGVSPSGAFDRRALTTANLAVGNTPHAPALEALLGPLRLRAASPLIVALAGAAAPLTVHRHDPDDEDLQLTADSAQGRAIALDAGDELALGAARTGLRTVIAVRGGLHQVLRDGGGQDGAALGSLARDTLAGIGPAPLDAGDALLVGDGHGLDAVPPPPPLPDPGDPNPDEEEADAPADPSDPTVDAEPLPVPLVRGPRDEVLGEEAWAALTGSTWTVRSDSDRVGVRLDGPALPVPDGAGTLPSEAMLPGAVQVPPSGLPVVFGPDHPTTGGYPVIGVVTRAGLDLLAQAVPGTALRFLAADRSARCG